MGRLTWLLRATIVVAAAVVAVSGTGCSAYDSRYGYDPSPADIEIGLPDHPDESVRTLVSVIGVRRADEKSGLPASVELRLRIENHSPRTDVVMEPENLSLVAGNVDRFPDPIVRPASPTVVPPQGHAVVELYFPFPDGRYPGTFDLAGLNLRWTLAADGHESAHSATFTRRPYYDCPPAYGWRFRYGFGFHHY